MRRRVMIGMTVVVLATALLLPPTNRPSAVPMELNVWSAFPELHEQVTQITGKYIEKNPNIRIKTALLQRALEEKVAVALHPGRQRI